MRLQNYYVSLFFIVVLNSIGMLGGNNELHPAGRDLAREFPRQAQQLREGLGARSAFLLHCQECREPADMNFLFGAEEQPGRVFVRCQDCHGMLHRECLNNHACHEGVFRARAENNFRVDRVWETREQLYREHANREGRAPHGFGSSDGWVRAYIDEEEASPVVFNALVAHWLRHLRNPGEPRPTVEEIFEAIDEVPGHTCAVCLESLEISVITDNQSSLVSCHQCRHEMHVKCAIGLVRSQGHARHRCPSCRANVLWREHPARSANGSLAYRGRPGYERDDRVLACAVRTELYKRACLFLAAQHPRRLPQNQEQEEARRILERYRQQQEERRPRLRERVLQGRAGIMERMQDPELRAQLFQHRRYMFKQELLCYIRKTGISATIVSLIGMAAFPQGTAVYGLAAVCSIIGGTSTGIAHGLLAP